MIAQFLKKKSPHLILFFLLIVYVISANFLYITFFLRNGKPIDTNPSLPAETNNIEYKLVNAIKPVLYDGQTLYLIRGYALHNTLASESYSIKIVFHSTSENLIFETYRVSEPSFIRGRPDFTWDMRSAEFQMRFAKEVFRPDNYRIGIIIEDLEGNVLGLRMTNSYIEFTPNTFRFIYGR